MIVAAILSGNDLSGSDIVYADFSSLLRHHLVLPSRVLPKLSQPRPGGGRHVRFTLESRLVRCD